MERMGRSTRTHLSSAPASSVCVRGGSSGSAAGSYEMPSVLAGGAGLARRMGPAQAGAWDEGMAMNGMGPMGGLGGMGMGGRGAQAAMSVGGGNAFGAMML